MFDRTLVLPGVDHMAPHLLAAASFLTGFTNPNTRAAYALDLRLYFEWCAGHGLDPLAARRMHLQAYVLHLAEQRGNAPASISRRIGTLGGYYACAVDDRYLEHSPCVRIKLPAVHSDPTKRVWLNRFELGSLLRTARSTSGTDWALIALMGTIGMRVSAACAVQLADLSTTDEGYRCLYTVGKGGKPSLKVLPIPVAQAVDAAAGERTAGPLLLRRDRSQMTRRSAATAVTRLARSAGISKPVTPHSLRRSFATLALQAGVDVRVVQHGMDHSSTRTTLGYDALGVEPHAQASHTIAAMLASAS